MTKHYEVVIEETRTYRITVEADSEEQAGQLAFDSDEYMCDSFDDTDSVVTEVQEVEKYNDNN